MGEVLTVRLVFALLLVAGCHDWSALSKTFGVSPGDAGVDGEVADAMNDANLALDAMPGPVVFSDDFEAFTLGQTWVSNETHGSWKCVADGGATISVIQDGSQTLYMATPSTTGTEVHFSQMVTVPTFGDLDFTVRLKTISQQRAPTPTPEDVGWVLWHFTDPSHAYYFIAKVGGWELGKLQVNPTTLAQERKALRTGTTPTYALNSWYLIRVRQVGDSMMVWVNSRFVVAETDSDSPYLTGSVGVAQQECRVRIDDLIVHAP